MGDAQEFSQGDFSNLRRFLGKLGPDRAFDVIKEAWKGYRHSMILATANKC